MYRYVRYAVAPIQITVCGREENAGSGWTRRGRRGAVQPQTPEAEADPARPSDLAPSATPDAAARTANANSDRAKHRAALETRRIADYYLVWTVKCRVFVNGSW